MKIIKLAMISVVAFLTMSLTVQKKEITKIVAEDQIYFEEIVYQSTIEIRKYDPDIDRLPVDNSYDVNDLLLYIKEQCGQLGVSYKFALSILQEENPTFFRILDGTDPVEWLDDVYRVRSRPNTNGTRDYGLWQLNGGYLWDDFIPTFWHNKIEFNYANPYHSTYIAVHYIHWLYNTINQHRNYLQPSHSIYWEVAIAYNSGIGRILNSMRIPSKTLDYASNVMERINIY